jgi:hypothetical protein
VKTLTITLFAVLTSSCFIPFPTALSGQATQTPSSGAQWHEVLNPPNTNGNYDAKYSFEKCIVWVLKVKKGIIITADIPRSHPLWTIHQTVTIMKEQDGVHVSRPPNGRTMGMAEGMDKTSYDIFAHYYIKAAQNHPSEVQALFWGEYGIGQKP